MHTTSCRCLVSGLCLQQHCSCRLDTSLHIRAAKTPLTFSLRMWLLSNKAAALTFTGQHLLKEATYPGVLCQHRQSSNSSAFDAAHCSTHDVQHSPCSGILTCQAM